MEIELRVKSKKQLNFGDYARYEGTMYRVVANIDSMYVNLAQCMDYCGIKPFARLTVVPRVPSTAKPPEDMVTARICVAPTVEECITAIGLLGRFRRCLELNDGAMSYSNIGRETYPVLVEEFNRPLVYRPYGEQVADGIYTREHWILVPTTPNRSKIIWLTAKSILWKEVKGFNMGYACKKLHYTDTPKPNMNHPWINGHGHVLESSDEEEPYLPEYSKYTWELGDKHGTL